MSGIAAPTISVNAVADEIEAFVREHFQVPASDARFGRRLNLWEEGYVDSVGVVEMIEFLEQRFVVRIPEEVLFSPGFTSIDGIAASVVALRMRA
jgi:acyl carrier protein